MPNGKWVAPDLYLFLRGQDAPHGDVAVRGGDDVTGHVSRWRHGATVDGVDAAGRMSPVCARRQSELCRLLGNSFHQTRPLLRTQALGGRCHRLD